MIRIVNIVLCLLLSLSTVSGFVAPKPLMNSPVTVLGMQGGDDEKQGGIFGAIGDFFEELDAFVDDVTSRRLGAGAAFYGKRKSSFYGKQDKNRKQSKGVPDPTGKLRERERDQEKVRWSGSCRVLCY